NNDVAQPRTLAINRERYEACASVASLSSIVGPPPGVPGELDNSCRDCSSYGASHFLVNQGSAPITPICPGVDVDISTLCLDDPFEFTLQGLDLNRNPIGFAVSETFAAGSLPAYFTADGFVLDDFANAQGFTLTTGNLYRLTVSAGGQTTTRDIALSCTIPTPQPTTPLLAASEFNVFAFDSITGPKDIGGPILAVGDVTLDATSVNFQANLPVGFVAGGDVTFVSGGTRGDLIYGGTYTTGSVTSQASIGGSLSNNIGQYPLAAMSSELLTLSQDIAGYSTNATSQLVNSELILNGSDPVLNVFEVDSVDLNGAFGVRINAPAGSTVVINVEGVALDVGPGVIAVNGVAVDHVLWNFYEATSLYIHQTDFIGSALAPFADTNVVGGSFVGTLVTNSLTGSFSGFTWSPFAGDAVF
ncbi:MAG: choice-of-anchor A family protein, partial [Polyangiaceae bacterium]|nr:choice-of-anchor A family protein [Polyangiaceae bacterium]